MSPLVAVKKHGDLGAPLKTMSTEERDEILGYLKAVLSLLKWFGGGSFLALCALIALNISDHFDQAHIKKDVEWMRPKVERLWYRGEPLSISEDKLK